MIYFLVVVIALLLASSYVWKESPPSEHESEINSKLEPIEGYPSISEEETEEVMPEQETTPSQSDFKKNNKGVILSRPVNILPTINSNEDEKPEFELEPDDEDILKEVANEHSLNEDQKRDLRQVIDNMNNQIDQFDKDTEFEEENFTNEDLGEPH